MNLNYRSNFPYSVLAGTASIATIVIIQQTMYVTLADTPEQIQRNQQINQYVKSITVQVNRPPNSVIGQTTDGSGFIIKREGNTYTLLTCNHVVNPEHGPKPVSIRTSDQAEYKIANVVSLGTDTVGSNDLALITFNSDKTYPIATFRSSNQISKGSKIFVAGFPVNNDQGQIGPAREYKFQKGVALLKKALGEKGGYTIFYAALTEGGMSGGPVLDDDGKVIGVHGTATQTNSYRATEGGGQEKTINLDVAIKQGVSGGVPIDTFMAIAQQNKISGLQVDNSKTTDNPQQRIKNPQTTDDWLAKGLSEPINKTVAINSFTKAIALDSNNSIAYFNRADARYEMGDKQGAIADYNEAIRFNPNNPIAYYNRGVARYYVGDKQGAIADFTVALSFDPYDVLAYYSRGSIFRALKDGRGAFADFDQVVRLVPNLPQSYYNRALARAMFSDRQGTIADFTQAIALNPQFTAAYINRSLTLRRMGQLPAAIQDLNTVLSYEPNNSIAIFRRGLFRRDSGDRQGALEDLQTAANLFQQAKDTASYQKAIYTIERLQSSFSPVSPSQPNNAQPSGETTPDGMNEPI
ncbi:tetratricopeptide repeat protein [Nostoc flagelliforme FACHB-838]|uniref:Tetratricopeptide repeat protein n=1 Tax=Nostoc flagelliforme FACHB-838 TaxID=2692904 RepID=A0ABR8E4T3_9NOSO|nr:serine protease [Nostoc flagelliforme]MBD2535604.1 tetratricopeptide repeat protein [Nostoc flagelliforme FACHB-838]